MQSGWQEVEVFRRVLVAFLLRLFSEHI